MFNFIYAIAAQDGLTLNPKQIKKITKHIFNSGKELSESTVKAELKNLTN